MSASLNKVLIRCDAAPEIGFGHVVRCLALADELRDSHGCQVDFAMLQGPQGVAQVQAQGYAVIQSPAGVEALDEGNWLQNLITNGQHQVLILDVRTDLATQAVKSIRESDVVIATIDDSSDRRLHSDLAFYPPVPQVERMDWNGFTGKRFVGWDWVLLRPQFAEAARQANIRVEKSKSISQSSERKLTILVTMGGSDPAGFTLMALKAIEQLHGDIRVMVVLGGGFTHEDALANWLLTSQKTVEVFREVSNMASIMAQADLAIAAMGMTAYELAVFGVPTFYLCLTEDHLQASSSFQKEGLGQALGVRHEVSVGKIVKTVQKYLDGCKPNKIENCQMTHYIDGAGVHRIASMLAHLLIRNSHNRNHID